MFLMHFILAALLPMTTRAKDDWRGDPCARAGIPWSPFTKTARLDPGASARVVTRTEGASSGHFRTRQEIRVVGHGEADTILVDFDVLLSDESLQSHVTLVQKDNEVALIIDGHGAANGTLNECVVAVTTVTLPEKLHQLTVDATQGSIQFTDIKAHLESLEVLLKAGSIYMQGNDIRAEKLNIDVTAGGIDIDGGLAIKKQQIKSNAGTIHGTLLVLDSIDVGSTSSAGGIDLFLRNGQKKTKQQSAVTIQTGAGTINLDSELPHAKLIARGRTGSVRASIRPDVVTDVLLESSVGGVHFPEQMTVIEERRKGFVGRLIKGKLGEGDSANVVELSTGAGTIELVTSAASDAKHGGL